MAEGRDLTTIFYKLKLKRTRKSSEVFEKMAKSVKKRGATKKWICTYDENRFAVDFGDASSETFVVEFDEKKVCNENSEPVTGRHHDVFHDSMRIR